MAISLAHVTFDCADPAGLARFWAEALGRNLDPVDPGAVEFFASVSGGPENGPSLLFLRVPEAKAGKNRLHMDLTTDDRSAEVQRLVGLGARVLDEHAEWGVTWTVLADPEGNEFCVAQSGH